MKEKQGLALVTVLLLVPVVLIMVMTLLQTAKNNSFRSKSHLDKLASVYVAEAGLAAVLEQMNADPNWTAGFDAETTTFGRGVYTIIFNTSGVGFTTDESVNNLTGIGDIPGPRGPVPAHSAYVVVTGQVSGTTTRLETVISKRLDFALEEPLTASGPINISGAINIDGLDRVGGAPTDAGIHSNFEGAGPATIGWSPNNPGEQALITGKVSTNDARSDAIDFGPDSSAYNVGGGFEIDAGLQSQRSLDVKALVTAHTGAPSPTLSSGPTTIGAGVWHIGDDTVIHGDLDLTDGAEVYVSGKLTVNGAIRGDGSLYVRDETRLQGDAFVSSSNHLALLSGGDVHLTGFNGTEYIRSLGPTASGRLDNINYTIEQMVETIDTQPPTSSMGNLGPLDRMKHQISARPGDLTFHSMDNNQLGDLITIVQAEPPSPTRDFVLRRMEEYHDFFYWDPAQDLATEADQFAANPSVMQDFALQAVFDVGAGHFGSEAPQVLDKVRYITSSMGYDRLGDSFFQGLVYSNGDIHASNGVTVLGAMVTQGQNGQRGDIDLNNGVDITMIEEFFGDDGLSFAGPVHVKAWSR